MTDKERQECYRDINDALTAIHAKWGARLSMGVIIVQCDDGDVLVERGAPGKTLQEMAGKCAPVVAQAARWLAEEAVGLPTGKVMGQTEPPGRPQ